jgi:hypothetical protein
VPTHHSKIVIAQVRKYEHETVKRDVSELINLFEIQNNDRIVSKLKNMIPEYVSNNSDFQKLDH